MNILKSYLGRSSTAEPSNEEEELEILYDRVKNSVNLKDRREAISTILAIASTQRTVRGLVFCPDSGAEHPDLPNMVNSPRALD